jgi:hypothetical protein
MYDVLAVDPSINLCDLECLYLVVGLLSSHFKTNAPETLVALLPWVTACLGPHVTVGGPPPEPGKEHLSVPTYYAPQVGSSLHVCLVAPSGAGKSTLVNTLLAKLAPVFPHGVHGGSTVPALVGFCHASGGAACSCSDEAWSLYGDYLGKSAKPTAGAADGDIVNKYVSLPARCGHVVALVQWVGQGDTTGRRPG